MNRYTTTLLATLCTLAMVATSLAHPRLDALLVSHNNERAQLKRERDYTIKQIRKDHLVRVNEFKCAERAARRLCEPARSDALDQIRCDRRDELKLYRQTLADVRRSYNLAIRQAKSRYDVACAEVRTTFRVDYLPCGCPVNDCSCRRQPVAPAVCTIPIPSPPAIHTYRVMVPELYRVQTVREVVGPRPEVCTAPVRPAGLTITVGDSPRDHSHRPMQSLLRAFLATQ
jgi:hypothetical protein